LLRIKHHENAKKCFDHQLSCTVFNVIYSNASNAAEADISKKNIFQGKIVKRNFFKLQMTTVKRFFKKLRRVFTNNENSYCYVSYSTIRLKFG
jgi:hypothetical protein